MRNRTKTPDPREYYVTARTKLRGITHIRLEALADPRLPKGGPGRTTVAVNLAFEAAATGGEVLLVDADTYGGAVAHANVQERHR